MKFLALTSLTLAALAAPAVASPAVTPIESFITGIIDAPTSATTIEPNTAFPFAYAPSNWCEEGYNAFKVFLTAGTTPPTFNDVDTDGNIVNPLFSWGEFSVPNFGKLVV